jgi:hypothetical protein
MRAMKGELMEENDPVVHIFEGEAQQVKTSPDFIAVFTAVSHYSLDSPQYHSHFVSLLIFILILSPS